MYIGETILDQCTEAIPAQVIPSEYVPVYLTQAQASKVSECICLLMLWLSCVESFDAAETNPSVLLYCTGETTVLSI